MAYNEDLLWRWRTEHSDEITRMDCEIAARAPNPWNMDLYVGVTQQQLAVARERAAMRDIVRQIERFTIEEAAERAAAEADAEDSDDVDMGE
jgi:hypothetical protein